MKPMNHGQIEHIFQWLSFFPGRLGGAQDLVTWLSAQDLLQPLLISGWECGWEYLYIYTIWLLNIAMEKPL